MRVILILAVVFMSMFFITAKGCQQSCEQRAFITRASSLCEQNPFVKKQQSGDNAAHDSLGVGPTPSLWYLVVLLFCGMGLFIANAFLKKASNVSSSAGFGKHKYATTFEGYEEIVDGLLWTTKESTLVVTEESILDDNLRILLIEHIGITKSGRWFSLSAEVQRGHILRRELTPLSDSFAKKRLESHREAYEQHFGPVDTAL